jgi:uncharacterized protein (TIGR03118 family)
MNWSSLAKFGGAFTLCIASFSVLFCTKSSNSPSSTGGNISKVNMVSDTAGFSGARMDPNLKNAWGIGIDNAGTIYVSSNHAGSVVVYDDAGSQSRSPIAVLPRTPGDDGAPSGLALNTTGSFIVPGTGNPAKFIIVTEDGLVEAWNSGDSAAVVDTGDTDAVYKGVAIAADNGSNFIYAANFHGKKVDVFDSVFSPVTSKPFADASIPDDFGPFNIVLIDGYLYVSYAKLKPPDFMDDSAGLGNGYVNIFNTSGALSHRFVSQGMLNSPWGITKSVSSFGSTSGDILIGNFGDGIIHAYDNAGNLMGTLTTANNDTIKAEGLWAIGFPSQSSSLSSTIKSYLYFTAGPNEENNGLFGFLHYVAPVSNNTNPYNY